MDAASPIAAFMVEPLTSHLPSPVESIFLKEHKGADMHYGGDLAQIRQQITQIVLSSRDPETVLPTIAGALGEIFQASACLIVAEASNHATPQTAFWCADISDQLLQGHQALDALLTDAEPLAITDSHATEIELAMGSRMRAFLGIKTKFHSSVNGMVVVGRSQPYAWSDWEKELMSVVSESVAMAISQVQLQRQARIAAQYQTLIGQLTLAIRNVWESDKILQLAIAGTAQALQVDRGLILLLKYSETPVFKNHTLKRLPKAKATVVCEWSSTSEDSGFPEPPQNSNTLLNYSFWLSDSQCCQDAFINAPEPLVIADQRNLSPLDSLGEDRECIFSPQAMPALLMVPLVGANSEAPLPSTVLGFLVLQHSQTRPWQPEELDLVNWVSAQVSTAIIQNQALRQVQALVEERTAQLQRSLEVQAKLYEKTRHQIDQLRQLNQLKDEFLSTMNHELRTPLTSMALAIRMLRQPELPSERRAKYLDILEQQCTQEINLINDLLALQELESHQSPIQLQKIDLKLLIEDLAESFEQKWANKGLKLAVDLPKNSLMLQTDADSLSRILLELLTNAGKYSEPHTTVHLSVAHQVNQQVNQVILTLSNTGSGISPSELTYIFDKFRRGDGVTQQAIQGTGLGLALVKCLVQHLNGTVAVKSCPTDNTQSCETCFTLTLPQFFDRTKV
ncbi:MAG: GAF domain-containing protein [Aphanothece sp. CMT-3BRIN-NPC111]|jgi:signal transduction histidine kinase|nr:GAF domain-containing protein [Aphanothece sp. CMT-3BRIN-NPC111]